jgi:serine/threonine protein kinase
MARAATTSGDQRICPACNAVLPADASYCAACGEATPTKAATSAEGGRFDVVSRLDHATPTASVAGSVLAEAADPDATRTSPFTLRFASQLLEDTFRAEYREVTLRNARLVSALALILVVAFGALDAIIQPDVVRQLWLIRYGIITPYLVLLVGATYVKALRPYLEWGLLGIVVVAGGGILGMILLSPPPGRYFYYAGLILVIMYNYTFMRLRFAVANVAGWAVVGTYLAAELIIGRTPWNILVNNMFFFGSASIIGMFAAYLLESLARRNFLQDKLVKRAREFGSYRLAARLGEGGMGEVWRAEHRMLARPAAIKLIRPEMMGVDDSHARKAMVQRFEREAQATALLHSSHTVEVYDFGVTDEGTFYYVMELLHGYDLHTLVRQFGPLPPARAVHLLIQVCDSLAEAHEQDLIHRDVKPANIHVCRYAREADFVKVLDFGIVKWNRGEASHDLDVTQEGFAGTPSCMAPEQIAGDQPIDGRTDLYSLGCVAYWLLTGRHVFEASTVVQVLARHLDAPPAPPSQHAEQSIPPELDRIVLRCLEKDPARRPQSAEALAEMLTGSELAGQWATATARAWWDANPPRVAEYQPAEERTVLPSMLERPR